MDKFNLSILQTNFLLKKSRYKFDRSKNTNYFQGIIGETEIFFLEIYFLQCN